MPLKIGWFYKVLIFWELIGFSFTTRCQQHHLFLEGRKRTWTLYKGRSSMEGIAWGLNFSKLSFQSGIDIDLKLFAYYCNISIIVFLSIFRNMVRNVKLGHGLFDLIKTEQAAKVSIFKRICNCISHLQLQLYTWITVLLLNHFIVINTLVLY